MNPQSGYARWSWDEFAASFKDVITRLGIESTDLPSEFDEARGMFEAASEWLSTAAAIQFETWLSASRRRERVGNPSAKDAPKWRTLDLEKSVGWLELLWASVYIARDNGRIVAFSASPADDEDAVIREPSLGSSFCRASQFFCLDGRMKLVWRLKDPTFGTTPPVAWGFLFDAKSPIAPWNVKVVEPDTKTGLPALPNFYSKPTACPQAGGVTARIKPDFSHGGLARRTQVRLSNTDPEIARRKRKRLTWGEQPEFKNQWKQEREKMFKYTELPQFDLETLTSIEEARKRALEVLSKEIRDLDRSNPLRFLTRLAVALDGFAISLARIIAVKAIDAHGQEFREKSITYAVTEALEIVRDIWVRDTETGVFVCHPALLTPEDRIECEARIDGAVRRFLEWEPGTIPQFWAQFSREQKLEHYLRKQNVKKAEFDRRMRISATARIRWLADSGPDAEASRTAQRIEQRMRAHLFSLARSA